MSVRNLKTTAEKLATDLGAEIINESEYKQKLDAAISRFSFIEKFKYKVSGRSFDYILEGPENIFRFSDSNYSTVYSDAEKTWIKEYAGKNNFQFYKTNLNILNMPSKETLSSFFSSPSTFYTFDPRDSSEILIRNSLGEDVFRIENRPETVAELKKIGVEIKSQPAVENKSSSSTRKKR